MFGCQQVKYDAIPGEQLAGLVVAADGRGDLGGGGVRHLADEQDVLDGAGSGSWSMGNISSLRARSRIAKVVPISEFPQAQMMVEKTKRAPPM